MLEFTGLRVRYGAVEAVHGMDLKLNAGDFVAVLGANGAGKSSMMRGLIGVASHTVDAYTLDGRDVSKLKYYHRVGAGLSLVPEGREIFPTLSVRDNIHTAYDSTKRPEQSFADALTEVTKLFPRLKERIGQLAGTLSGGEQQMVAISRALVQNPSVLLLDEPSLGLAPIMTDDVMSALTELNNRGRTILMVEQDAVRALEVAHRAIVMRNGRVVLTGDAAELSKTDAVQRALLGEGVAQG